MRLFALLLTLLILGSGGYLAGSLPFHQDWVDIYQVTLTALGAVAALSTFFLGQTISRIDKLMEFPLDSLQQGAFRRDLKKRRTRLVIKYWIGFISGILAIALGNALKLEKLSLVAGCGTAFMVIGLTCLFLLLIEFFALTHLYERLREGSEQLKKKQAFLSGSAA